MGIGNGDADVVQEEQCEEALHRQVELRLVAQHAPGGADGEGEREAKQVQCAPGTLEGDGQHAGIEQGVIAEQADMAALAGGSQDRRSEAAGNAEDGQPLRILQHGQQAGAKREQEQHGEGHAARDQVVDAEGAEHHQHQYGHAGALQRQADAFAAVADAPGPA